MRIIFTILFLFIASFSFGQVVEKTISVGEKIYILPCKKGAKEFVAMDVYARTKPFDKSKIDTLTGEGLLQEFFNDKSIDAKRLPCSMGGYYYRIAAYHEFEDKGTVKRVLLCYTSYPLTLIWIELDKANELGEISFN
ncbi:MAG: hypothetical protein SGJ00_12580 [bacterium]|nr:hypothetical protein [bacterium]